MLFLTLHSDYFQMYAEALHENERLKSRLQDSKQELVKIRSQLEKVTQVVSTKKDKKNCGNSSAAAHKMTLFPQF